MRGTRWLLIGIIALALTNFILVRYVDVGEGRHLSGQIVTAGEVKQAAARTALFGLPLIGFLLGTLISLLPYRKLPYRKKYLRFSLVLVLVLQTIMLLLALRNLLLW
ncbi:hypothetical protein [Catalinimonas alkaloidigena]|uniref:hypothetical protein n=1 Tax=Catalinimonas alkaloidigena TaxID=1075417 RepID=UPI00115FB907|nr:hypothetical protein [Catalinimonas alkaloidigena]